jgi:glycosyltransferase involved in cell wall biosynthesis
MIGGEVRRKPRLLYDLTGLLHWYGYFSRPAGVQRMIEKIGACEALQAAARGSPESPCAVEFVVRAVGSDRFFCLDSKLLIDLNDHRMRAVARLRRLFAESLRRAPLRGLLVEGRYFHLPYLALGLLRAGSAQLAPVSDPGPRDAYYSPGDLWWQPGYAAALAGFKSRTGVRLLQVVHDFHVEERRDWSPGGFSDVFARELRAIAPHVDHWLTPSYTVRSELTSRLAQWSLPERPISAVTYGWDSFASALGVHPAADRAILARHGVGDRAYMLFVGTLEPRKNVSGLLDAVEALRAELGERVPDLVIAGGYGWRQGRLRRRLEEGVRRGHLFWVQNLDDRDLAAFYRQARFSVMPSLGEGFGLAIQESLSHGLPCIASAHHAMREAGRDLASYVTPGRLDELKSQMAQWIVDEQALELSRRRIRWWLDRGSLPTWNQAGELILASAFGEGARAPQRSSACGERRPSLSGGGSGSTLRLCRPAPGSPPTVRSR